MTDAQDTRTIRTALLLLLVAVVLAYWTGLDGGFIFDDRPNISANLALHVSKLRWDDWLAATLSSPAANFPRPLAMFSFAVNHYLTGLDPWPMKLTNVVIHVVNTLLVFFLARALFRAATPNPVGTDAQRIEWPALFTAAAWALHPINLMAVLYVVQRMESLCHLFVFSGLWLYVHGRTRMLRGAGGWAALLTGLLVFAVLGALSKESALLLPLYGFCLELCLFRFRGAGPATGKKLALMYAVVLFVPALLALAWLLPPVLGANPFPGRDFNLVERLLTELRVVFDYLRWTLFPNLQQMSIYQDDYVISRGWLEPVSTLLAALALSCLAILAFWIRGRKPLVALGLMWFLAAQAMTATIIPLELVFEHRNYFASFGICLVLADLLRPAFARPQLRLAGASLAIAFVVAVGLATGLRAWEWRNPLAFAISEAGKHPDSPRAVYALGVALSNLSGLKADSPLAITAFDQFDHARSLPRSNILPDQAALTLASRLGLPLKKEWWTHMQSRLKERPIGPQELAALGGLANCAVESRCNFPPEDMMETFHAALSQGPHPEVQSILANYMLNVLHQPDFALYYWHSASVGNPGEPQYRINLIKLLIAVGRDQDAQLEISNLRLMGRMGQYKSVADQLEARRAGAFGNSRRSH